MKSKYKGVWEEQPAYYCACGAIATHLLTHSDPKTIPCSFTPVCSKHLGDNMLEIIYKSPMVEFQSLAIKDCFTLDSEVFMKINNFEGFSFNRGIGSRFASAHPVTRVKVTLTVEAK